MILDLKDRIRMEDVLPSAFGVEMEPAETAGSGMEGTGREAIEALVALGYSLTEASKAVRKIEITEDMTVEAVLKASLKYLAI